MLTGQAQKEFTVNEALARVDLLLHPAVIAETSAPPPSPSAGACYLVGANATGEFAGHEEAIAGWDGAQWTFAEPVPGMALRDLSTGQVLHFDAGWQRPMPPENPTGGTTVDTEAREAIAAIIAALRAYGIFS